MEDIIKKTQSELGAVIEAPKLTEKLLSRPPFRFLHDIVVAVLKASSFPESLYSDDQLDSAKVTDKKAKLEFLEQLIAVVAAGTGKPVSARAAKIAAGEEPEKTNELLQGLAVCAGLPAAQKQAAVSKVKGGGAKKPAAPAPAAAAPAAPAAAAPAPASKAAAAPKPAADAPAQESEEERQKRHEEERRRRHEEKKREREKEKEKAAKAAAAEAKPEASKEGVAQDADAERRQRREEKKRERDAAAAAAAAATAEATTPSAESTAAAAVTATAAGNTTTSARKAPPRTKPTHEVIEAQHGADATPAAGVIRESKHHGAGKGGSDDEDDDAQDWQKVAAQYEAKPTARTAAVAEDVEVRGMLGQQALKAKRDQEAAARGEGGEGSDNGAAAAAPPSSGGIVIHKSRNTVSRGGGSHALGDSDLNQLREQLQMLTKASNPLGKFLEAIHDDIDSMTRELEMWRSESRSQALAATEARRQTEESLQEIHANLQNLEDAISDQMQKTNNLRQTILSNDAAMETMMKTIVNPDITAQ
ncbi:hypothetical protein ABL78_6745 [Leptomonas seymouri]|uniref:TRAF3-interacting protein 1 n=1 Tax=Leptomonas seymouri TaxID=5684 RepID=A0A0N1I0E9_LEPSE|nr:hypothetical protein ABL78_6745 [Leptomonas seymouri]|eukprot:KPI84205.1 hypothetical protein ABL78_6745 [Leptomonas seymouri]